MTLPDGQSRGWNRSRGGVARSAVMMQVPEPGGLSCCAGRFDGPVRVAPRSAVCPCRAGRLPGWRRAIAGALLALTASVFVAGGRLQAAEPAADRSVGDYDCVIKPSEEVHVASPVSGLLRRIAADRGDTVRAGQVIAELDSDVDRAAVAVARRRASATAKVEGAAERVSYLKRKRDRSMTLSKTQFVAAGALDEAETDLAVAQQNLADAQDDLAIAKLEADRAEAQLAQKRILSPIDGVVTERKLSPGEFLTEQQWVVTVVNVRMLHVEVFVPVALHGRLRTGGAAVVSPDPPVGGRYPATIEIIDRVYDAASGTFGVRLLLPNPDMAIPAGIRCRIRFD